MATKNGHGKGERKRKIFKREEGNGEGIRRWRRIKGAKKK